MQDEAGGTHDGVFECADEGLCGARQAAESDLGECPGTLGDRVVLEIV